MQSLTVKLTGVAPLILHNNQGVDPLNYYSIEIKKVSSKRAKTPADLERLSEIEFHAGLYLQDNKIVIPTKMQSATFVAGAKKDKHGPIAKAGVYFDTHALLDYDGESNPDELFKDKDHVSREPVKVSQSTIIRTRPIFNRWSVDISMQYEPSVIDESDILMAWEKAGQIVGMGDWRPQHGRFTIAKCG